MIKLSRMCLGLSVCLLMACSDDLSEQYADWQAVNESGSIKRGWIPKWLPKEATNIQERHNIDTNALALSFEVPDNNFTLSGVECEDAPDAPKPRIRLASFPVNAHEMDNLKICGGYYVHQSGRIFYLWQNES